MGYSLFFDFVLNSRYVNNEKYFVRIYVIFFVFLKMSHWVVFITHQDKV